MLSRSFSSKLKELITLFEKWLSVPKDSAQLKTWIESAEEIAYGFEFSIAEQKCVDQIIDIYEEEFKLLLGKSDKYMSSITKEFLDKLINSKQIEQRTPEWYAQMTNIISASELGNLFASPRTRALLVISKTRPYTQRFNPHAVRSIEMSAFDWGIRFEPVVKQIYEEKYKVTLKELGRLHHPIDPRCTASPDGLVYDCPDGIKTGRLIEIKCPVTREIDGTIPKDYYAQMQMQLQVTQCNICDYVEAQFSSQYNLNPIKNGPGLYNGFIALIKYKEKEVFEIHDQRYYYIYSPVNIATDWVPTIEEGEEIIEIIPWNLLQWSEQIVQKNEEWWTNIQPAIQNFWDDVEKAKRGEFTVPESSRIKKQKEEKCVIVFKMPQDASS